MTILPNHEQRVQMTIDIFRKQNLKPRGFVQETLLESLDWIMRNVTAEMQAIQAILATSYAYFYSTSQKRQPV